MGQGSDTDGTDRGRSPQHGGGIDHRGAFRHRCHALRHGDARFALALPHGQRSEAGGRRCIEQDQSAEQTCNCLPTARSRTSSRRSTACGQGMWWAREATSRATSRPARNGLTDNATPFWMVGRGGAGLRWTPRPARYESPPRQRRRRRHRITRRSSRPSFRARRSCTIGLRCSRRCTSRRAGAAAQRLLRRIQDSGTAGSSEGSPERGRHRRAAYRPRTVPKAWARPALSASRPRSVIHDAVGCGSPRFR